LRFSWLTHYALQIQHSKLSTALTLLPLRYQRKSPPSSLVFTESHPKQGAVSEVDIPYDYLVVAVGAETATFGIPGVAENSVYMKSVEDSAKIRNRIMDCFETAVIPGQPEDEIRRLLHFVVVGGGPSGVEYTAELHDFVERDVKQAFPAVADKVKITLVEALPHILNMFDARLIDYVEKRFDTTPGMNLMLKSQVTSVEPKNIKVKQDGEVKDVPYVRAALKTF